MPGNYKKVKSIILKLCLDENIKDKIIVVGGTVPYLISKKESNREHSDIDIIVKQEDMLLIRKYLEREKLSTLDSLKFPYNKFHIDYGVDATIDGVTVNFAPYESTEKTIIQRNFLTKQSSGIDALVTVTMKGINPDNVFTKVSMEGIQLLTYSLEMIKIMKEKSNKKKDAVDIKVIENYGYDKVMYSILKEELKDMEFKIEPKNKLLKLLFR